MERSREAEESYENHELWGDDSALYFRRFQELFPYAKENCADPKFVFIVGSQDTG